jgi:hypothetical protein
MDIKNISITVDEDYPNKVEIHILEDGVIVEGGQFDMDAFVKHVLEFYSKNY